ITVGSGAGVGAVGGVCTAGVLTGTRAGRDRGVVTGPGAITRISGSDVSSCAQATPGAIRAARLTDPSHAISGAFPGQLGTTMPARHPPGVCAVACYVRGILTLAR